MIQELMIWRVDVSDDHLLHETASTKDFVHLTEVWSRKSIYFWIPQPGFRLTADCEPGQMHVTAAADGLLAFQSQPLVTTACNFFGSDEPW